MPVRLKPLSLVWIACLLITGCTVYATQRFNDLYGDPRPVGHRVARDSVEGRFYLQQVEPLLESRCVACHACYEAPCQLKLTAPAGIERGVNKERFTMAPVCWPQSPHDCLSMPTAPMPGAPEASARY